MKQIVKTFCLLIIALFTVLFLNLNNSSVAHADTLDENGIYTVQDGDTLWDISNQLLGDPTKFNEIYDANANIIAAPELIFPGQQLTIGATSNNSNQENNTEIKEEENTQQESQTETQIEPQTESEPEQEPKVEPETEQKSQVEPGVEQEPQTETNIQEENNTINNENNSVTDENGFTFSKGEEDQIEEDTTVSENNSNNSNSGKLTFVEDEDTNTEKGNGAVYNFLKQFKSMSPEKIASIFIFGTVGILVLVLIIQIIFTLIPRKVKRRKVKLSRKEKKENKKNKKNKNLKPSK